MLWMLALTHAAAEQPRAEVTLTYALTSEGRRVGIRKVFVRPVGDEIGMDRIVESTLQIEGAVGSTAVALRHRFTAHVDGREPAAFTASSWQPRGTLNVQGRWTPNSWVITTTAGGETQARDVPLPRVDLSTADLVDPYSRVPLAHFQTARILSALSGEIREGAVEPLGVQELSVGGTPVMVSGFAWTSAEGRHEYFYSPDGYLVRYRIPLLGGMLEGRLDGPVPGAVDDFVVAPPAAVDVN